MKTQLYWMKKVEKFIAGEDMNNMFWKIRRKYLLFQALTRCDFIQILQQKHMKTNELSDKTLLNILITVLVLVP